MKTFYKVFTVFLLAIAITIGLVGVIKAATNVNLGTTDGFAILASSTVTNTGPSVITGDLGLSPGTSVTGFPPGIVSGTQHVADGTANTAQSDLVTAYNAAAGQTCNTDLSNQNLGGMTLTPGTYCFSSSAQLTGTLTLDAQNDPNSVFIFQIGSTLTTASSSVVSMINGGQSCHVFWQVGSSATLGTTTSFIGNIMALASITLNTNAFVDGRLLARTGAVTLDTNTVTRAVCSQSTPTPSSSASATATPAASTTPSASASVAAAPKLPNTGSNPGNNGYLLEIIVTAGIFFVSICFYIARKKQTI